LRFAGKAASVFVARSFIANGETAAKIPAADFSHGRDQPRVAGAAQRRNPGAAVSAE